ncbi:MAG: ammonia channel protein [Proteobacteria bacterium]|nr:MAG: ammonia channel protein [Pseudomonadota bacterium]
MTFPLPRAALPAVAAALTTTPAFAQSTLDRGDTAWMITATVLVLLMIVPGLALFYGGLVRAKNLLSVLTQVTAIVCMVSIVWVVYGYSLAFTGDSGLIGDFSKAFLAGIAPDTLSGSIPEYVFLSFQMTFACITTALIVGGIAERMRFAALLAFAVLWVTFVYFPLAHMVWSENGYLMKLGALDFAGGTVVHINSGIAALVGALMLGKRIGYGRDLLAPHSLPLTMVGGALLWVGWFGFNAGSALQANGTAALAMVNTFVATAAAGLAWMLIEWATKGAPSLLGLISGAIAGLVAVTPAAGLIGPMGAIVLGAIGGAVSLFFCTTVKNALRYDDSLDVFGIHAVAGIVGSIGTGILVSPSLGGVGVEGYDMATQVGKQVVAVAVAVAWCGIISAILYKVVDVVIGLRVSKETEREGLDLAEHTERAYNM